MVENGKIIYRDSNNQQGNNIITRAGYGVEIFWKLDPKSGLKEIKNVEVQGDLFMLAQMPRKVDAFTWVAKAGIKGEGQLSYNVVIEEYKEFDQIELTEGDGLKDPSGPIIRLP